MVTGIEFSGLVLGLFPIVINGITFCINSAAKFQETVHYRRTLIEFRRELALEESVYINTLSKLVSRAGVPIAPNTTSSPKITASVLGCLPAYAQRSFAEACEQLNTTLEKLEQKFKEYEQNRV